MTGSKHRGLPEGSMGYARLKAGRGNQARSDLDLETAGEKEACVSPPGWSSVPRVLVHLSDSICPS